MSIHWDKTCEVIGTFDKYTVYWAFGKDCTRLKVSTVLSPLYRGGNWLQVNSFGKLCTDFSPAVLLDGLRFCPVCVWCGLVTKSCLTLATPCMDCSPWGSSVPGIGLPFSSPGYLPNPRTEPRFSALQADSLLLSHQESPMRLCTFHSCSLIACSGVLINIHTCHLIAFTMRRTCTADLCIVKSYEDQLDVIPFITTHSS